MGQDEKWDNALDEWDLSYVYQWRGEVYPKKKKWRGEGHQDLCGYNL